MSTSPSAPEEPASPYCAWLQKCRLAMRQVTRTEALAYLRAQDIHDTAFREACEKLIHQHFDQLDHATYKDPLTGLDNRAAFEDQLAHQLDMMERYHVPFALGLIDLDGFKQINDSLGHAGGDEALKKTAAQLSNAIRESDILTRYGGDEFAMILPYMESEQLPLFLDRLRTLGQEGYPFSMGWVHVSTPGAKNDEIVAKADQALYEAKQTGRHAWSIFPLGT